MANGVLLTGTGAITSGWTAAVVGTTTTITTTGIPASTIATICTTIGGWIGGVTGASIGGTVAPAAVIAAESLGVPIATTTTVVTAPAWAIPVAVAGGIAALGVGGWKLYRGLRK